MENTELRLNNLVYDPNGKIDTIHALTGGDCWLQWFKTASYFEIKPIPLAEEWLIKLDFEDTSLAMSHISFRKGILEIVLDINDGEPLCMEIYSDNNSKPSNTTIWNCPKNVHQLQNLFYCLTGRELTLK